MRIISGRFKGTVLGSIGKGNASTHLRPTTDRVRESIFNLLVNGGYGDPVTGARVLDLFAGTGALGFEALSRGASYAYFVDKSAKAGALIGQNAALLQVCAEVKLARRDAVQLGTVHGAPYDLAFLDPPYGRALGEKALAAALVGGWLAADALVVWEENAEQTPPGGFEMLDVRKYGNTWVQLLRAAPNLSVRTD